MHQIYLALGTNIGDRPQNLRSAIAALPPSVNVLQESRIYETEPWGYLDQPAFLNMALKAETSLSPRELLNYLKDLEVQLGRTPNFRNGPRLLDMDILFFDDLCLNEPDLVIPHPRIHERSFVLVPLTDIAPGFIHPLLAQSVTQMLNNLDVSGIELFQG